MMLNEFEEFKAYTTFPDYTIKSKRDTGYLGRFTYKMIKEFRGFNRILTILARGYMWETDVPDVERAYRALCAWCSLPESVKPDRRKAASNFDSSSNGRRLLKRTPLLRSRARMQRA